MLDNILAWLSGKSIGSFDYETCLIRPGLQAPPPVCLSWCTPSEFDIEPAHEKPLSDLLATEIVWFGANIAFDCAAAMAWGHATPAEIFAAYETNRLIDFSVFETVARIGNYTRNKQGSLAALHRIYGLGELEKGEVRTSYESLLGAPLEDYSEDQLRYALLDAKAGYDLARRMVTKYAGKLNLSDVAFLSSKQFWLYLARAWGLRTDPNRVDILEKEVTAAVEELQELAQDAGIVRSDGTRDMKAIRGLVSDAYDGHPPMTVAKRDRKSTKPFVPNVRTDSDTLLASGNPILEALSEFLSWKKIAVNPNTGKGDLVFLKAGTVEPIHTRYGLAETTRSTSSKPNVQNVKRASRKDCVSCGRSSPNYAKACSCGSTEFKARQGIRECFIPRPGYCYVAIDHSGLELATLAQVCVSILGRTDMASKINRGEDLHCHVAAEILGITYDSAVKLKTDGDKELKNARNCGKVVNFGRPGGMAAPTLSLYAKQSYGIEMTVDFAADLIRHWERANPDGVAFLRYVRSLKSGERFDVQIPGTTIRRNQTTYCAAANCHFQGLGAVLEAAVGWDIAKEMYCGNGVLSHCRNANFIHDEFMVEVPIGLQTDAAARLDYLMTKTDTVKRYLPDVQVRAEAAAMTRWSKSAEGKYDNNGNLMIWGRDY